MDKDIQIQGIKVIDKKTQKAIIDVVKNEFEAVKSSNPFLDRLDSDIEEQENLKLSVKEIDYDPNKKSLFKFFLKGKLYDFKITDPSFLAVLKGGRKFGLGDYIIANIKIHKILSAEFDYYIPNEYEIYKVIEIVNVEGLQKNQTNLFE